MENHKKIYKDEIGADKTHIHLMVNLKCTNKCRDCCNLQYDLTSVPVVAVEELKQADTVMITGGEPFAMKGLLGFLRSLRHQYKNIRRLYVYTSGAAMYLTKDYWMSKEFAILVDGINFSPKGYFDEYCIRDLFSNRTFCGYMKDIPENRFILIDYFGKQTNDDEFIKSLHLENACYAQSNLCKQYKIEQRKFQ